MNTPEIQQKRDSVANRAANITAVDYTSLFRKNELGDEVSFEIGADSFDRIWRLLKKINAESLTLVSNDGLERISRFTRDMEEGLGRIRTFRLSGSNNPLNDRNAHLNHIDALYRDVLRECPELCFVAISDRDFDKKLDSASSTASRLRDIEASTNQLIENQKREAQDILEKMRQASGRVALTSYSSFFSNEATSSQRIASIWLGATAVVAIAVTGYLVWLAFWWTKNVPDYSMTQLVQVGGAKLALFSALFYLLSWCGRNFRAQWHLVVVNRHRAHTLNALEAFANSANNDATREAILIHASSAIFSQVQTGFIPDQSEAPSTPSILEIVRGKE